MIDGGADVMGEFDMETVNDKNYELKRYWNAVAKRAADDDDAFIELYNYFFPLVYKRIMYLTHNEEVADEVISTVFMQVHIHLDQFDEARGSFFQWILGITKNEIAMYFRRAKQRQTNVSIDEDFELMSDAEGPEELALKGERHQQLRKAIEKLPAQEQKVIKMKYWLDMPNKDIATALNITPNNVAVINTRAQKKLRDLLADV